jgi:hypothetical protein
MKPMSPSKPQRSAQNKLTTGIEYQKKFRQAFAFGVISLLVIMLPGGPVQIGQSSDDALFIDKNGRVGIGTTTPEAELDVAGSTKITGSVGINRVPADDQHLAIQPLKDHIPLNVTDPSGAKKWLTVTAAGNVIMDGGSLGIGTTDPGAKLEVVGDTKLSGPVGMQGGNVTMNGGNVGIGTASPEAKLDVAGNARIKGQVTYFARYQRDDETEGVYEISPRYHLSLTGVKYGGRTKTIPQDTLIALCGDYDGCQVRLAMTRWASDANTESASVFFTFYYSAGNGRWRASNTDAGDANGVDGDGKTTHVRSIWDTCYFTDGTYDQYRNQGDPGRGMQLLVWNHYNNQNRTCELTLID